MPKQMTKAEREAYIASFASNGGNNVVKTERSSATIQLNENDPVEAFAMLSTVSRLYPELKEHQNEALADNEFWKVSLGNRQVTAYTSGTCRFVKVAELPRSAITELDLAAGKARAAVWAEKQAAIDAEKAAATQALIAEANEGL